MPQQSQSLLRTPPKVRKQVTLNIAEPNQIGAPRVTAGNYQVAVPQIKQGSVDKLVMGLGNLASAGLRHVTEERRRKDDEVVELIKGLDAKEAEVLLSGDVYKIDKQLGNTIDKLDKAQRKGLLRFVDNPQNYVRANKQLGIIVAQNMANDIQSNPEEYTKGEVPVAEQFDALRKDVLKGMGLQGSSMLGFNEASNALLPKLETELEQTRNDNLHREHLIKEQNVLLGFAKQGEWGKFTERFQTELNPETYTTQAAILRGIAETMIVAGDFDSAQKFITELEKQNLIMGNQAQLGEDVLVAMSEALDDARVAQANQVTARARQVVSVASTDVQTGLMNIGRGQAAEGFSIELTNGEIVEIEGSSKNESPASWLNRVFETLDANGDKMNPEEQSGLILGVKKATDEAQMASYVFAERAGVSSMLNAAYGVMSTKTPNGESTIGLTDQAIDDRIEELGTSIHQELEDIFHDSELSEPQKMRKAQAAVIDAKKALDKEVFQASKAEGEDKFRIQGFASIGLGPSSNLVGRIVQQFDTGVDPTAKVTLKSPERTEHVAKRAQEFNTLIHENATEIWNRSRSEAEANLTEAQLYNNRKEEINTMRMLETIKFTDDLESELKDIRIEKAKGDLDFTELREMEVAQQNVQSFLEDSENFQPAPSWMGVPNASKRDIQRAYLKRLYAGEKIEGLADYITMRMSTNRFGKAVVRTEKALRVTEGGANPMKLSELATGTYDGFIPMNPSDIDWTTEPILGPEILADPEANMETIQAYMDELDQFPDLDSRSPEHRQAFIESQIYILRREYGVDPNIDLEAELDKKDKEKI